MHSTGPEGEIPQPGKRKQPHGENPPWPERETAAVQWSRQCRDEWPNKPHGTDSHRAM